MYTPKAIGFDLFNTLITIHPQALTEAHQKLVDVLHEEGIPVEAEPFGLAYVEAAKRFLQEAHKDGRETHNRYWIAAALEDNGYSLDPEDARIARVVEAYFSTFYPHCRLVPGTMEMLGQLAGNYRLGLLSNFTHSPAVLKIIDTLELAPFFQTVLVSGELGYRKPHPSVFERLVDELGVPAGEIFFVGDDIEADVYGAREAGLQPVLTTCVADEDLPRAQPPRVPSRTDCPPEVPRISCWQELLSLLED